jgi:hypothetical protein
MPKRVDQSGPGRRKVAEMVGELPINPVDDVATGNVADEQEQAVRTLIQPAVSEVMPGQGTIGKVIGVGAGLESLVVPTVGERPIPLELVAARVGGEGVFDFRPRHVPMSIDVPIGDGVGNSLMAKLSDQPIEDLTGVMVGDCPDKASSDRGILKVIDPGDLASKIAHSPNKGSGTPDSLLRTRNGDPGWHVRSTQLTGVERRYRRRCSPGLSESTGDRRESEHPATTHRPCGPASRPG